MSIKYYIPLFVFFIGCIPFDLFDQEYDELPDMEEGIGGSGGSHSDPVSTNTSSVGVGGSHGTNPEDCEEDNDPPKEEECWCPTPLPPVKQLIKNHCFTMCAMSEQACGTPHDPNCQSNCLIVLQDCSTLAELVSIAQCSDQYLLSCQHDQMISCFLESTACAYYPSN